MYYEDTFYGLVYAIMKSLNINELEIENKYYAIKKAELPNMYITNDVINEKTKIFLKEDK